MLDQSISKNSISYVFSDHERFLFNNDLEKSSEDEIINGCIKAFNSPEGFPNIPYVEVNNKKIFKIIDIEKYLLHKRLNETLKTINRVKQSDRESIVRSICNVLKDMSGYSIHRLDISGFYENVSLDSLRETIFKDDIYSNSTKVLAAKWFDCFKNSGADGLPRGLSISSTLSEIYMKSFDDRVRFLDGTLYYARFVDDIFYVSTKNSKLAYRDIYKLLPSGIEFSDQVKKRYLVDCEAGDASRCVDFNYLGYRFKVERINKKNVKVNVGLSNDKITKIKGRLSRALIAFYIDDDFDLLDKRFRFLTCNYILNSRYRGTKIRSGIYYNYKSITEFGINDLKRLDEFKNNLIFIDKFRFSFLGDRIDLTIDQKKTLAKRSFLRGHKDKKYYKFSVSRIVEIKGCWK